MADETPRAGGSGLKALLAWMTILGLIGAVGWLVSEQNARTWFLVPEGTRLVVMRGMHLPMGRRAFATADPALAAAYAPLTPPPGTALPAERAFEERAVLDQAIFDLLAAWARDEIASADPARLDRGLGYLARAERLGGISAAQREELRSLRAESGYHEAGRLIERAARDLRDAAEKLRLSAASSSSHAIDAQLLLKQVEPAVDATLVALRAASAAAPEQKRAPTGAEPATGPAAPGPALSPGPAPAGPPAGQPARPAGDGAR